MDILNPKIVWIVFLWIVLSPFSSFTVSFDPELDIEEYIEFCSKVVAAISRFKVQFMITPRAGTAGISGMIISR